MKGNKGQGALNFLMIFLIGVVTVGITLVLLNDLMADASVTGTTAETAINDTVNMAVNTTSKFPLAGTILGFGVVIGVLGLFFVIGKRQSGGGL